MCHMQTICFVSFSSFFFPPPQSKVENVTKSRKQHPNQTLAFPVPSILLKEDKKKPIWNMRDASAGSRSQQETFNGLVICAHAATLTTTTTPIEREPTRLFFACADRRLIQATTSSSKKQQKSLRSCRVGISGRSDTKENKKNGSLKWIRGFFLNNVLHLFIENYCCVICAAQCIT